MAEKKIAQRSYQGEVVSAKMNKTIIVKIDRKKTNEKYAKQYRASTKFHVHDEKGEYKVGDIVRFVETRPLSKTKKWRAVGKVTLK
jgi:small subunit ribosomal protein S17